MVIRVEISTQRQKRRRSGGKIAWIDRDARIARKAKCCSGVLRIIMDSGGKPCDIWGCGRTPRVPVMFGGTPRTVVTLAGDKKRLKSTTRRKLLVGVAVTF